MATNRPRSPRTRTLSRTASSPVVLGGGPLGGGSGGRVGGIGRGGTQRQDAFDERGAGGTAALVARQPRAVVVDGFGEARQHLVVLRGLRAQAAELRQHASRAVKGVALARLCAGRRIWQQRETEHEARGEEPGPGVG
jgi:hypothetical protein